MICRNQWLTMGGGRMFANSGFSIDTGSCSLYGATISLGIGRPFSLLCSCALHWYYRKCARQVLYCDKHQPSHRLIRSELIKMSQFVTVCHRVDQDVTVLRSSPPCACCKPTSQDLCIPHICHFFYTCRIFENQILHPKKRLNAPKTLKMSLKK